MDMQYGNASRECMQWAGKTSFLDALFSDLTSIPLIPADSPTIKTELTTQCGEIDQLLTDSMLFQKYCTYDRQLFRQMRGWTFDNDDITHQYKSIIEDLFADAFPLIHKLKLHYQRPRPFQLAAFHQVPFYPVPSLSAHCPSFPSAHSCLGALIQEVCGNIFPKFYIYFKTLADDLYLSRRHLGVCLPADVDAGRLVAEKIVANKEFKVKYGI
jgi:hypothetical protein